MIRRSNSVVTKSPVQFAFAPTIDNLDSATIEIHRSLLKGTASFCEIAYTLAEVDKKKLASSNGEYKNTVEYAEKVFGFKHAQTSNYIKLANRFLIADAKEKKIALKNVVGDNAFSVTQLTETLTLPEENANNLIKAGKIHDGMTAKEIREVVKAEKIRIGKTKPKDEDVSRETPGEDVSRETPGEDVSRETMETVTFDSETLRGNKLVDSFETAVTTLSEIIAEVVDRDFNGDASQFVDPRDVTIGNKLATIITSFVDIIDLLEKHGCEIEKADYLKVHMLQVKHSN